MKNEYLIYREKNCQAKRNKMYRVPTEMSHLQFIESLYTHLITFKKRKSQRLINTSAFSVAYGKKTSNDMPLPSFDFRMSHQSKAYVLVVQSTPISINNVTTKFTLRLDR